MKTRVFVVFALLVGWQTISSYADPILTTGQVVIIAAPPSVAVNAGLESNTSAFFFTERVNSVLPSGVSADITSPGTYNSLAGLTPGTIAAGTVVDSFYLHTDPIGTFTTLNTYIGSVTFDTDILGVIVLDANLNTSVAILGHLGTLYSLSGQGLELGAPDTVVLSPDGRTVSFSFASDTAADDIRIITAAAVPEPSTLILLGTGIGMVGLAAWRRKK